MVTKVNRLARLQGVVDGGALDAGEAAGGGVEEFRDELGDQGEIFFGVLLHAAENLLADVFAREDVQAAGFEVMGEGVAGLGDIAEIGEKEVAAGAEAAADFGEESGDIGITVGRLDVEDDVEGTIGEGQSEGIARGKGEIGYVVAVSAEGDGFGVAVEGVHGAGFEVAGDVGGSSAVAATDFEEGEVAEVDGGGDAVIELDAGAVGFVLGVAGAGGGPQPHRHSHN